jgi:hypothetical protein
MNQQQVISGAILDSKVLNDIALQYDCYICDRKKICKLPYPRFFVLLDFFSGAKNNYEANITVRRVPR